MSLTIGALLVLGSASSDAPLLLEMGLCEGEEEMVWEAERTTEAGAAAAAAA
jgi:hypothetical protein